MLEGKTLGNDVCGVIGAMLEHGSCEQSAKEFRLAGLEVQRHIRGHPEFAAVEMPLNGEADHGPPGYVIAQQFTGRDVGDIRRAERCRVKELLRTLVIARR